MTSPKTTEYRRKIVQSNNRDFIVKYEDTKKAPHFGADQKFFNPWRGGLWQLPSLFSLAPFVWNTNKAESRAHSMMKSDAAQARFPLMPMDVEKLKNAPEELVQTTWIGHATSFVQLGNRLNFLTDPVFSERASMFSFAGPKRFVPTPFSLTELRRTVPIDFVVISHNHYDHLDANVVNELGNQTLWLVPLGLKRWFVNAGVDNVVELDW